MMPDAMPNDAAAEEAVLGAMLIETPAIRAAKPMLGPEMFYQLGNGTIFEAAVRLYDQKGGGVDVVTLSSELRRLGKLDQCGGLAHLSECIHRVATAAHVEHYAKIVARLYYEREIIKASQRLAQAPGVAEIDGIRDLIFLRDNLSAPSLLNYKDGLGDVLDNMLKKDGRKLFKTGIGAIDRAWVGARGGEINTWGAATNDGKSVLLLNLMDLAAAAGHRCLYVGTEMSAAETIQRHVSVSTSIPAWKLRKGELNQDEIRRIHDALAERLADYPVSILDHAEPSLKDIEAAISSFRPQIVFLDYLERFTLPKEENLRLRIKEFMRQLKNMARRCDVVVHLAVQLNRQAYGKTVTAPTMAEIAESSSVERESDRVMLMWAPPDKNSSVPFGSRILEVHQAKNRHGPRGTKFDLQLDERTLRITERNANETANEDA